MAACCDTSDAGTSSQQRPVSVCNAVTTDTWKGRLDFDRACTDPEQRCWLCTELTPWNQAMHELVFELVELRPGKLRLRPTPGGAWHIDSDRAAKASFLASWLLQHHRCIDELKFPYSVCPRPGEEETTFPICRRPPAGSDPRRTIRGLEVEAIATSWFNIFRPTRHSPCELEGFDAVEGLEKLKLELHQIRPELAAELARLLRRNASSIRRLEITHAEMPLQVNRALRYLFSCETLTIYSSFLYTRLPSMQSVARLLHSSTALKELNITPVGSSAQISAIAKELKINTSLTKLGLHMADQECSLEAVFTALQDNTTLKELRVTNCHISGRCRAALFLLLQNNTGLRLLYIGYVNISEFCLLLLAAALTRNSTLESLHLSSEKLPIHGIAELCKVLRVNKRLTLQLAGFVCPQESRTDLARQLAQDECYGRVQLAWAEPDLPGLTAALTSSVAALEELCLSDIRSLSVGGLEQLFNALTSSKCVRTLRVRIMKDPGEKGTALCKMLKVNKSIACLHLVVADDNHKFVEEVLRALAENASIAKIVLNINVVYNFKTATAVSYFLAHNKTATKFFFSYNIGLHIPDFVEEFSKGMLQNKTIVKFQSARNFFWRDVRFPVFEAVRRNRAALNRAVDFVISPSLERQCAEGFERFSRMPCLLKHLKKVSGNTEPEALLAIAAAERYLRDNYLLITGIVRHSVKCHPAENTQVDSLNKYCWLAIVRHLKVADVLI